MVLNTEYWKLQFNACIILALIFMYLIVLLCILLLYMYVLIKHTKHVKGHVPKTQAY